MVVFIVMNARSSASSNGPRSCPEEYRELRVNNEDSSSDSDEDQWREDVCDQAMDLASKQPNSIKYPSILRTYCAHYDEATELTRENNDTSCENKKQEINSKRKRQQSKKKRDSDDDDDDDEDKRRALRKKELNKRLALRFIRKRLL